MNFGSYLSTWTLFTLYSFSVMCVRTQGFLCACECTHAYTQKNYVRAVPLLQGSGNKDEILAAVITAKCLLDIILSDRF